MGEAKNKGQTHEERREHALERNLDEAEMLVFLKVKDGKLVMQMLNRDDPVDAQSLAVQFAAYLSANFEQLAGEARALASAHHSNEHGDTDAPEDGVHILPSAATRGVILGAGGGVAKGSPGILGANGQVLSPGEAQQGR